MAIQIQGNGGTVAEVDATFRASRVTLRPAEQIGYYSVGGSSGAVTGISSAPVFSFRNTGANLMLIRRVSLSFVTTTAFTTPQALTYWLLRATGFTVSDAGQRSLFVAGSNKRRTSFTNISSAPDIRMAETAGLTAGTRTLETVAHSVISGFSSGLGAFIPRQEFLHPDAGDYPMVLAQNEGFIISNQVIMGAAGVIQLNVVVEFAEASAY